MNKPSIGEEIKITQVEYDPELADKNLIENDFSNRDDDDGLTPEQIEKLKKDLEARNGNN
jgi:hypothetical protein